MAGEFSADYVCDECDMGYGDYGPGELAPAVSAMGPRWREAITGRSHAALRGRPDARTWSVLEYGWHLGTVLDWMAAAIDRMFEEDHPEIGWFGHEQDVEDAEVADRSTDEVTARLDDGVGRLATVLASRDHDDWGRGARFPWGERDALDMARNAVHEGEHHLHDVTRILGAT